MNRPVATPSRPGGTAERKSAIRFCHRGRLVLLVGLLICLVPSTGSAQQWALERLPADVLDVVPPSDRVRGAPGEMVVHPLECRSFPLDGLRRRIVDVAVQEWAFFGFPVLDRANGARLLPPGAGPSMTGGAFASSSIGSSAGGASSDGSVVGRTGAGASGLGSGGPDAASPPLAFESSTRRAPALNRSESARVAASIAGYWAVTPEGAGIVADQNRAWSGPRGVAVRWRSPWSAAFISWVMCEAGLETNDRFRRAIAHWSYIDQAIRARDGAAPEAAYVAYDIGERTAEPGDLLCSARRPAYRNLAERRRQMGGGARTHCDIVVRADEETELILAIGGNVLRSVSLKVLAAERDPEGGLRPRSAPGAPLFAHLKLRADPIGPNALTGSPTIGAFGCLGPENLPPRAALVLAEFSVTVEPGPHC